jgi:hypothetical protein
MAAWNFSDQEWDAYVARVNRRCEGSLSGCDAVARGPPGTTSQASPDERAGKALSWPRETLSASRSARRPSCPQKRSPGRLSGRG